jgi:hypothetical protein
MNARGLGLSLAGLVAAGCFLPDVEFDANAGKAGASAAGTGGDGSGGTAGTGGSGGSAGLDLSTQTELDCGEYCDLYFTACNGHEANTYDDKPDCFLTCVTSDWPLNDPNMINAPGTIDCRKTHAGLANTQGADPHCFHSAEVPTKGACEVTTP